MHYHPEKGLTKKVIHGNLYKGGKDAENFFKNQQIFI